MHETLTSWEIIAYIDVSVTGDIRIDLMLASFIIWAVVRTKP